MKTKEFIKRVKELGYNCFTNESYIFVSKGYPLIATIALHKMYCITLYTDDNKLGELCIEYAKTPIEEREEEEKFYLQKMKSFYDKHYNDVLEFLNFNKSLNQYFLFSKGQYSDYKTQFTQKEIDEIKGKYSTNLEEFKQIPVEED